MNTHANTQATAMLVSSSSRHAPYVRAVRFLAFAASYCALSGASTWGFSSQRLRRSFSSRLTTVSREVALLSSWATSRVESIMGEKGGRRSRAGRI